MVKIFKANKVKKQPKRQSLELNIDSIDSKGMGVARHQGKVFFVSNALPSEQVLVHESQQKSKVSYASTQRILVASNERVKPKCEYYNHCGGCQLQHLSAKAQLKEKQTMIAGLLKKAGWSDELKWQNSVESNTWHYRDRARLACYYDRQQDRVSLGFRQAKSKKIVELDQCPILNMAFSLSIEDISQQLNTLAFKADIGHVDLNYIGAKPAISFHFNKVLDLDLFSHDAKILLKLADKHQWACCVSQKGSNLIWLSEKPNLSYELENCVIDFSIDDFTQINSQVNKAMLRQVVEWLAIKASDNILDLYSGLGNFSLPLAKLASKVIGIEGMQVMVDKANTNAQANKLNNVHFFQANLDDGVDEEHLKNTSIVILDPARHGAESVCRNSQDWQAEKVLYISCEPNSLARDGVHLMAAGYKLDKICLLDMFPNTAHVETMALFVR